ncbi:beta-ketoacyl-[acyl-carrier-protein] synthase family protein [Gloeobacter violaceus]|uniref:Gll2852 protein n=1 Tax=Gloeobacter violaceus (strain ATCC 29082 / PCC 7421) TaxID=251221 RepID=Q7NCX4_GLOVI|nr:beta-ketoacyl synthase [Gloeobacter violaceus]BAC90793.1 gll2852 [Gloeobacter violaceus PCC 7421]
MPIVGSGYAVTGIGLATPMGCEAQTVWNHLSQGRPLFGKDCPGAGAGRVDDHHIERRIPARHAQKLDRFTMLAMIAGENALADSHFEIAPENCYRVGLVVGNSTGGWTFLEPTMQALYSEGMKAVNSYTATAWFPTAAQGEISIHHRIGGYSKTVCADRLSAGFALELASVAVERGRVEAVVVGGTEAPLSDFVLNAYAGAGCLSPSGCYAPFEETADGRLLAEGSAMLVLELSPAAAARGAKVHCEILAIAGGDDLAQAMRSCLHSAGVSPEAVDYIVLDAFGTPQRDDEEYRAIGEVFANHAQLRMSAPKSMYGDLVGAGVAMDVIIACMSIERQAVLPTAGTPARVKSPPVGRHVVGRPEAAPIRYALVNARDEAGRSLALLLAKPT